MAALRVVPLLPLVRRNPFANKFLMAREVSTELLNASAMLTVLMYL